MLGHFPNLFEPGLPDDNGIRYYETDLLFSPEAQKTAEYAAMKKVMAEAANEKWPKDKPSKVRSAFRPAPEKVREKNGEPYYPADQFAGWELVRVKTKQKPGIVDGQLREITDPSEVYAGALVRCTVNPNAYSVKGNSGVSFWLNNVQKVGDSAPLSGGSRARPEDDFSPVEAASTDVDAMFD